MMKEHEQIELLAPAGSYESMKAAFAAGADAVYIGGSRFGARAYADNLDEDRMCQAIDYAHLHGRRLYMTVNTLFKERELVELVEYLKPYYLRGLDGAIVQDLGAMALMGEHFPGLPLHASTQMTIVGVEGARKLKSLGASRVVTARELSLEEIRAIHEQVDIQIESFIHGALCYCYSGQCLMSSLIGGRSGNRGRCAQPCRLPYTVLGMGGEDGAKRQRMSGKDVAKGQRMDGGNGSGRLDRRDRGAVSQKGVRPNTTRQNTGCQSTVRQNAVRQNTVRQNTGGQRADGQYVLNLKDLCTLDILPQILEAGVCSLKIEGRMKSPRYTAGVESIYRKYVDRYKAQGGRDWQVDPADERLLLDLFDRGGFTEGYYEQHNGRDMVFLGEKPAFRKENQAFFAHLDAAYIESELKEPIKGAAVLEPGEKASLTLWTERPGGKAQRVTVYGQEVQKALDQPMTRERILKQLGKTGNSPFSFTSLDLSVTGEVFMPVQALNELRRMGLEALERAILEEERPGADRVQAGADRVGSSIMEIKIPKVVQANKDLGTAKDPDPLPGRGSGSLLLTVSLEEQEQLAPALADPDVDEIYIDADGYPAERWADVVDACHGAGKKCRLMLPHIFRQEAVRYFRTRQRLLLEAGFDGTVVRDLEGLGWLRRLERELASEGQRTGRAEGCALVSSMIFDPSLYAWNHLADQVFLAERPERTTMPLELNSRELLEKGCAGQELLVYGALPMMVSAQCVRKTVGRCIRERSSGCVCERDSGCSHESGGSCVPERAASRVPERAARQGSHDQAPVLFLKDRTGKAMPVKSHCTFCYSTIYNASPLMLLGMEDVVKKLGPSALRLQFTTEGPGQVARCLRAYADRFRYGLQVEPPCQTFTRGHMKRGVE